MILAGQISFKTKLDDAPGRLWAYKGKQDCLRPVEVGDQGYSLVIREELWLHKAVHLV